MAGYRNPPSKLFTFFYYTAGFLRVDFCSMKKLLVLYRGKKNKGRLCG